MSTVPPTRRRVPSVLFFISEDWYLMSHRLELARATRDAGYRTVIVTRLSEHADALPRRRLRGHLG